jgi:signal transduction histidine kinase
MVRDLIAGTQRLVKQLQAGARSFVWNLRENSLASEPLAAAIRTAAGRSAQGREVEILTLGDAARLPESIGHELLRVAQEATTNAVRHGDADLIKITLDFAKAGRARLLIEDNGKGFDPDAPVPEGHFGLLGMRERVLKLRGDFQLRSNPGKGTSVEVIVPGTT